jgi:adenosylcobinamide amidohydrolase
VLWRCPIILIVGKASLKENRAFNAGIVGLFRSERLRQRGSTQATGTRTQSIAIVKSDEGKSSD